MHKQKGAIEIILVVLLVVALIAAGWFWWQKQAFPYKMGLIPSSKEEAEQTKQVIVENQELTKDWKMYDLSDNDIYQCNYIYKLPKDWKIEKGEGGWYYHPETSNEISLSMSEFASKSAEQSAIRLTSIDNSDSQRKSLRKVTIRNHDAFVVEEERYEGPDKLYKYFINAYFDGVSCKTFFGDGTTSEINGMLLVDMTIQNSTMLKGNKVLFDQILSTFKFLD